MLLLADCGARIFPWPSMAVPIGINSFVHIFVYAYYLLAAINPSLIGDRAKRFVTEIQVYFVHI